MVVIPFFTGVTSPLLELTVAISGLLELHVPVVFVFEKVMVVPKHKLVVPFI